MPRHNFAEPRGTIERWTLHSGALRANRLGDPADRTVAVYLSPGYDPAGEPSPVFVGLAGFTSGGLKLLGWQSFGESLPQRIDRLIDQGELGPLVVVLPDCFTSLGGNQYVNSPVVGRWEDFLLHEVLPEVERRYHVRSDAVGRAVFGKSSGGYGALIQALRHGDCWGAVACHSGDIDFDLCYRPQLAQVVDVLAGFDGDAARFIEHVRRATKIAGHEMFALMMLAMCATYDPDPDAAFGVRLPVDARTCALIDDRWQHWLRHDPLRIVEQPAARNNLTRLRLLFLDCGSRDQFAAHFGARRFAARLAQHEIAHVFEEFDDDHSGIDYRLDRSLPLLYRAVTAGD
ncbi:MAG TPA: alpha/beta hydrolase-fold protein [Candidatus Polarisedimenticolaceae bacterium]|nr:alpha/beta hydrolase-fold protein [Candidatus Polarisedimenticolaceae bacterium]